MFRTGSMDENSFLQTGHKVRKTVRIGLCTSREEFPMRRVAPCYGVLTARTTPTAQAGWMSWYVSAPRATRETQTDRRQVRAERSPRGVHNTAAAPRQPHMKNVSSFSTNSSTVSRMSNSSANTTANNTAARVISTVLMDLKCLPCDETNEDRQAQCHQRIPVTISFMSNSSGKHYDDNTTTRLMSTVQMVRTPFSAFSRHTQEGSMSTLPATNSGDWTIMSNTSDSTHDPNRTSRSEVMVRVSPSREGGWEKNQRRGDLEPMATRSPLNVPCPNITVVIPSRANQIPLTMFRTGSMDENSFLQTGHKVRKTVRIGLCTPRGVFPMRRVAPCHGVLTARMTPTAQAGWKSWYVSAPMVTFYARCIATQTSTDTYVCATPLDSARTWKMYTDCWVTCLTVKTAKGKHYRTSLTALSTVGHEIESEPGNTQLHQQRVPSNTSQNFAPI